MSPARPRRMPGSFASGSIIAYDGTDFSGWAAQPGRRTVQGVARGAPRPRSCGCRPSRLTVAGRTDAGVHASGQVAHLDVPEPHLGELGPSLLRRLGRGAAGRRAGHGGDRGVARLRRPVLGPLAPLRLPRHRRPGGVDPLRRHDTLAWPRPLDVEAMATAAHGAARRARLRRVLPPPRGGHVDPDPAAPRRRRAPAAHRVDGAGRRVLLLDGALAGRGAARGGGRPARPGLAGVEAGRCGCGPTT